MIIKDYKNYIEVSDKLLFLYVFKCKQNKNKEFFFMIFLHFNGFVCLTQPIWWAINSLQCTYLLSMIKQKLLILAFFYFFLGASRFFRTKNFLVFCKAKLNLAPLRFFKINLFKIWKFPMLKIKNEI